MIARTLILLAFATLADQARAEEPAFDVLHYSVRLNPDFETQSIAGQSVIFFTSTAKGLSVLSFSANSLDVTASVDGEHIVRTELQEGRRLFHLPKPMRKGAIGRLVVTFKGKAPKGLVWAKDHVYANYFTCDYMICDQDRPGDKARVRFEVIAPGGMVVVSAGSEVRPLSAYLLGFAVGRFDGVSASELRVKPQWSGASDANPPRSRRCSSIRLR